MLICLLRYRHRDMSHWRALTSETRDSLILSLIYPRVYLSWYRATIRDTVFKAYEIDRPYDMLFVYVLVCVRVSRRV